MSNTYGKKHSDFILLMHIAFNICEYFLCWSFCCFHRESIGHLICFYSSRGEDYEAIRLAMLRRLLELFHVQLQFVIIKSYEIWQFSFLELGAWSYIPEAGVIHFCRIKCATLTTKIFLKSLFDNKSDAGLKIIKC